MGDQEVNVWRWIAGTLLTANIVLLGIVYRGAVSRLSEVEKSLNRFVKSVIAMSIALNPEKAETIMKYMGDILGTETLWRKG